MAFEGQRILPAAKSMKQFEAMIEGPYRYGVMLETHIAQLQSMMEQARRYESKILLHADLVQGLKTTSTLRNICASTFARPV